MEPTPTPSSHSALVTFLSSRAGMTLLLTAWPFLLGLLGLTGPWIVGAGACGAFGAFGLWNHQNPQLARLGRLGFLGFAGVPFLVMWAAGIR